MVPLRSAALTSMSVTTLASVGRLWSLRFTEVTPLHVNLVAHVSVLCGACYVLAMRAASRVPAIQIVLHPLAC